MPGQSLAHNPIEETFFSWTAQPGKKLTVYIMSADMEMYAPPQAVTDSAYLTIPFDSSLESNTVDNYPAATAVAIATVIPGPRGAIVRRFQLSVVMNDYRDCFQVYLQTASGVNRTLAFVKSNQRFDAANLYMPPGSRLFVLSISTTPYVAQGLFGTASIALGQLWVNL